MRFGLRSVAILCDKNFYNDRFAPPVDVRAPFEKASDASKTLRKPILCKKMNIVELAFYEVRLAQEATQYAPVIATVVRRCDHVASKVHRGPPALLHGDVEGYRGTIERLGRAS